MFYFKGVNFDSLSAMVFAKSCVFEGLEPGHNTHDIGTKLKRINDA